MISPVDHDDLGCDQPAGNGPNEVRRTQPVPGATEEQLRCGDSLEVVGRPRHAFAHRHQRVAVVDEAGRLEPLVAYEVRRHPAAHRLPGQHDAVDVVTHPRHGGGMDRQQPLRTVRTATAGLGVGVVEGHGGEAPACQPISHTDHPGMVLPDAGAVGEHDPQGTTARRHRQPGRHHVLIGSEPQPSRHDGSIAQRTRRIPLP